MEDTDSQDLESFRRQWKEEVSAKLGSKYPPPTTSATVPGHGRRKSTNVNRPAPDLRGSLSQDTEDVEEDCKTRSSNDHIPPQSALEHYEKAVEKEAEGNLGDSLHHYRTAFRVSQILLVWIVAKYL